MKIIKNEKLITRNAKIGKYTNIAGLVLVGGTAIYLFQFTRNPEGVTQANVFVMWGILFLGILISQVSMFFGTRWGRRPDEALDKGLKGLPGDYTLFHYSSPVPHLLVGPAGVWLLVPYLMRGDVTYRKNRWRVSGGGFAQGYLRVFGQESIGRPDIEVGGQVSTLEKFLKNKYDEGREIPPISAALVFLDDQVNINANEAPLPTLQIKKLKDHIRKVAKEHPFPVTELERVKAALSDE